MNINTALVTAILWKSKKRADGECPIWLRITKSGKRTYVTLKLTCTEKLWDFKINLPKKNHPDKSHIDLVIGKAIKEYKDLIIRFQADDKDFTSAVLVDKHKNPVKRLTVFKYIESKIAKLKESNNIGNCNTYKDFYCQLKRFLGDIDITFSQIDYLFLQNFEAFFRKRNLMDNTISIKFRTLKAIYNSAIVDGCARKENFPFDKFKISERFSTTTQKRAISKTDILKIADLIIDRKSTEFEAQKYFMFSYHGLGINFADIANLKWSNLRGGRIYYKRQKTKKDISFSLSPSALHIIEQFKPTTVINQTDYIFPILNAELHITATQKVDRVHKVLTRVNRDLKKIGLACNIDTLLTSYCARHSYATIMKQSGVPTAVISESMGHASEEVTQIYLRNFDSSVIDEAMKNLI